MNAPDGVQPAIFVSENEADALYDIASNCAEPVQKAAKKLIAEIDRANIVRSADVPDDVVTMGSQVEFTDERSGVARSVNLVWPQEADMDSGRLSVLTLVGAGLIGMRAGSSIAWPDQSGQVRQLRISKVTQPQSATENENP